MSIAMLTRLNLYPYITDIIYLFPVKSLRIYLVICPRSMAEFSRIPVVVTNQVRLQSMQDDKQLIYPFEGINIHHFVIAVYIKFEDSRVYTFAFFVARSFKG